MPDIVLNFHTLLEYDAGYVRCKSVTGMSTNLACGIFQFLLLLVAVMFTVRPDEFVMFTVRPELLVILTAGVSVAAAEFELLLEILTVRAQTLRFLPLLVAAALAAISLAEVCCCCPFVLVLLLLFLLLLDDIFGGNSTVHV